MQTLTCMCLLLVLILATLGVQGVSHDKLASSRVNKLRAKLGTTDKVKAKTHTVATSARTQKRGLPSSAAPTTTLLQTQTKAHSKETPASTSTDTLVDMDSWATSPTEVTATPLTEPSSELPDDASVSQILQAYTEVEGRVANLEEGRRDAVWNRADIASAQGQAVRIIQAAQEAVAAEKAQHDAMSTLEVASKKDTKEDTQATSTEDDTAAAAAAAADAASHQTEAEGEEDPCCTNAKDAQARAAGAANAQSIADMQAEVTKLTDDITKAIAPPAPTPEALAESNAAAVSNEGTGGTDPTNTGDSGPKSTGSAAECNTHLNKDTLKGDSDIWKEEAQAKKDALDKLLQKVEPQFTTGMAVDQATLTKTTQMLTDNVAKHTDFKNQLAKSCSESTCDLGASGGLLVEADTPNMLNA